MAGNRTAGQLSDQIQTLHDKHVSEEQDNGKIYAYFVNFKKAFDSIWHDGLLLKLLENEIGSRFYDLIGKSVLQFTMCSKIFRSYDIMTLLFSYQKGIRPRGILSLLLFNIYRLTN